MCTRAGFGLFVGYLNIVCSIIAIIVCVFVFANKDAIDNFVNQRAQNEPNINVSLVKTIFKWLMVFLLISAVVSIVLSAYLINGILKRRHKYMAPWLVVSIIGVVLSFIFNLYMAFRSPNTAVSLISTLLGVGLQVLIIYPIYSLYREIRSEKGYGGRHGGGTV